EWKAGGRPARTPRRRANCLRRLVFAPEREPAGAGESRWVPGRLRSPVESVCRKNALSCWARRSRLPGVDEAPPGRRAGAAGGAQGRGDHGAGLSRIDHVVELEQGRRVERLRVALRRFGQLADAALTLLLALDRVELLAQCQPDCALEAH